MMRKILSILLILAMFFAMLPYQVFAIKPESADTELTVVPEAPVQEETQPEEDTGAVSTRETRAGENALVIHYFLASPGNITNPNGTYVNYYGPDKSLNWWPESYAVSDIKQDASWNTIYSQQGIRNIYDESIVTKYVASWPTGSEATFKDFGSVTINGRVYSDTEYEIKWVSIMCRDNSHSSTGMRCNQRGFEGEHIHIDGLLVEKVQPGEMEIFKAIPEALNTASVFQFTLQKMRQSSLTTPPASADDVDTDFAPMTLTASIAAGATEARITGGSEISFGYYKLTEQSSQDWQMDSIALTDERGRTQTSQADALYICIAPNGTVQYSTDPSGPYAVMSNVVIENTRKPVTVSYQWQVYNTNGTYTSLPASAPNAPAPDAGVAVGSRYVYDTEFATGTSYYDYDNGLLYSFHGWDTHSHSSAFNPIPSSGYYALDDGDSDPANNPTIEITADTYIYGYWTVTEMKPASAHIAIEKVFIVDGVQMPVPEAEDLWFHIDTGYDGDGDGYTTVDVDYHMISAASNGEYKIPVYQYDTPFVFTEHNAEVAGYTRTTTVTVSGDYIVSYTQNGDGVTVTMDPVYQGENIHLGTVTYTNTYTRNVGAPIHSYPELTILKSAADTQFTQDGVVFTLYRDEACTQAVASVTTADGGLAQLRFGEIENVAPGTYYLKETAPLAGYYADPSVYALTVTASESVEELRNGQYVQVTYHTLSAAIPDGSTATFADASGRLHIYNEPVLGSLSLNKEIQGLAAADVDKLDAIVIVHGPISRNSAGSITDIGKTWQLELNSENGWKASLSGLPLGEYLIHESFASVHGYTWNGVTYGNLETTVYNNITSGIFKVESETAVSLTLTNSYQAWTAADFYIKKVDDRGNALAGAVFTLSTDEAGSNVVMTKTTGADGYGYFGGFTVPEGQTSVIYYLRETKAPDGYYLSNMIFRVVITAVTAGGKTTYEPEITPVAGRSTGFDISTDLLTVVNLPVLGELTLTKAFTNGVIPVGLTGVSVKVDGPHGYTRTVELNDANNWSVTLNDLALGEYTVSELDAGVSGYSWTVAYSSSTVTLAETDPGLTVTGDDVSGVVTVTNTYIRNDVYYDVPTSLTVKKVGENNEALAGAVFKLERLDKTGKSVIGSVSFTTGADGTVVFDLLTGFADENGSITDGKYILSETKAPAGYEATNTTWNVTVRENNGQVRVVLNENQNVFENFWDWIVGNVSPGVWENGVLTVKNVRSTGNLTVQKNVTDPQGLYGDAKYSFTLDCSDDSFDKTFTLSAGESYTVENIPWGILYTLTEDTTGAAFTSAITDAGNGKIWAYETVITVENTYAYTTGSSGLHLVKVDAEDNGKMIRNAGFTLYTDEALTTPAGAEVFSGADGTLTLPVAAAGTYYLVETTTPEGYRSEDKVYVVTAQEVAVVKNAGTSDALTELRLQVRIADLNGTTDDQIDYVYHIENTPIKTIAINVEKVWEDGDYSERPQTVEVVLYRNEEVFDTVTLSGENNWRYSWIDLTDEYSWRVDENSVSDGYTKTVTASGYDFTITNTRAFDYTDVSVKKIWYGAGVIHPESVSITLYRNGAAYDTVTLNASNNWSYTWEDLSDASQWTVDEPSVPSGYNKTVRRNGNSFTVTNTYEDNPKTGDFTNLFGTGAMALIGTVGFGVTALKLIPHRKKEEDEE